MGSYYAGFVLYHTREFYRRQKNKGRALDLHIQIHHLHLSLMILSFSSNRKFANLLLCRKLPFMYELIVFFQFTFNNPPPIFKTIGFVNLNCLPLIHIHFLKSMFFRENLFFFYILHNLSSFKYMSIIHSSNMSLLLELCFEKQCFKVGS